MYNHLDLLPHYNLTQEIPIQSVLIRKGKKIIPAPKTLRVEKKHHEWVQNVNNQLLTFSCQIMTGKIVGSVKNSLQPKLGKVEFFGQ